MTGACCGVGAAAGAGAKLAAGAGDDVDVWVNEAAGGAGMFHRALQGWPTCTGPEPLAVRPAVHGCPTWTPPREVEPEATLELAAESAAIASEDGSRCVAQPAVTRSSTAGPANHCFFI